jgi:FAD/FMN-containing dehydrogenase
MTTDKQTIVFFIAKKHNIRLVVKSTGHDYVGRSNAPNSLSIWVHHIKGLKTLDSFRPSRCKVTIDGTAVTAGAGMQMWDLYSALDAINQTVVGGGGKTVSLGGYLTGAGHGLLAPRYGLAADQVYEMEVVTPSGEIVIANECQNQDLFWAMRGVSLVYTCPELRV